MPVIQKIQSPEDYARDARNIVWGMAGLLLLPLLLLPLLDYFSRDVEIEWGLVNLIILGVSTLLAGLAIFAGRLCMRQRKVGWILGNLLAVLFYCTSRSGPYFRLRCSRN